MIELMVFISVVLVILSIWSFSQQPRLKREREEKEAELKKNEEEMTLKIQNLELFYQEKIEPNIKSKDSIITIVQKPIEERFMKISYYLWKEKSCLFFCPVNNNENYSEFINNKQKPDILKLNLSEIEYYTLRKTEKSEIRSSGGEISGGGSSLTGALVGGVVAGGVGAVIGSRKQIKGTPLKIETVNIKQTDLYINYYGIDSIKHTLFLMPENLTILRNICPEKDFNFKGSIPINISSNDDLVTKIKKLKELHDLSIISDDDFNTKKKELLDQF